MPRPGTPRPPRLWGTGLDHYELRDPKGFLTFPRRGKQVSVSHL